MSVTFFLAALLGLVGPAHAGERYTAAQLQADYYFDLGADSIDVSSYPKAQRENYAVFSRVCSQCHTLARPINSPIASRADWRRYIRRMADNTKVRTGTLIDPADAKRVIDFLAFDSARRKVRRRADFNAETRRLKALFADVRRERAKEQMEANAHRARSTSMGEESQPHPQPGN